MAMLTCGPKDAKATRQAIMMANSLFIRTRYHKRHFKSLNGYANLCDKLSRYAGYTISNQVRIPPAACSSMWQWNNHFPGLSAQNAID